MFCKKCGAENDDNAFKCTACGAPLHDGAAPAQPAQQIPNYLVQSILVTLFCCLPFGIAAIVFAAQVNTKLAAGDIDGAMESSRKAKMWCWWSFGLGLAISLLYMITMIGAAAAGNY